MKWSTAWSPSGVQQSLRRHERTEPPIANQCSKGDTLNFCTGAQKKFNSRLVAPTISLASFLCGSFWGFTWFNRKVEFSLFIAYIVTTYFSVIT
jgi:hypothetical protein